MTSFEEKDEAFWKWLEANGATLSKDIAIKDYRSEGAGRGVITTKDIKVEKKKSMRVFKLLYLTATMYRKESSYFHFLVPFCYLKLLLP